MNEKDFDFSYSGIVNYIQNDNKKASELVNIAAEINANLEIEISNLKNKIRELENQKTELLTVPKKIAKHLDKELPFYVTRINKIIKVDNETFTIIDNFI